jgi:hypothetical protein
VALPILGRIPNIEELSTCLLHSKDFREVDGPENVIEIFLQRAVLPRIQESVIGEVWGSFRLVRCKRAVSEKQLKYP